MKYAFSPVGIALIKKYGAHGALLAFDFDGTLAPTVADPERAKVRARTVLLLERLSLLAPTAAITGRSLHNIRTLVPTTFQAWAGNHGAELFPTPTKNWGKQSQATRHVKLWSKKLEVSLDGLAGVWLENKRLSLCIHFRHSPNRTWSRHQILSSVATLDPSPRVLAGKCVVNLLSPLLPHKGNAVQNMLQSFRLKRAIYVGDDANDEDVFALADPRVCTIRVGRHPDSRATLYLKRQSEIDKLLQLLLHLRERPRSRYRK